MSTPDSPDGESRETDESPTVDDHVAMDEPQGGGAPSPTGNDHAAADEPDGTSELDASADSTRRVRARWVLAGVAVAAVVVWVIALTVGPRPSSGGPGSAPPPAPAPATLTPGRGSEGSEAAPRLAQPSPGESEGQTAFLSQVRKNDKVALDDANAVGIAFQTCAALRSGSTRAAVEAAVVDAGTPDPRVAGDLVGAAIANLCPEQRDRPLERVMRDGSYRAGSDVEPGRYRAPGGDGCTWTRSTQPGQSLANIIDSGSGSGPSMTVTLEGDQYFDSSRCGDWTKS